MNLSTIRKASERQQAAFKQHNTFADVIASMEKCHLGRIEAANGSVSQRATPEELEEAKRLQMEFPDRQSMEGGV